VRCGTCQSEKTKLTVVGGCDVRERWCAHESSAESRRRLKSAQDTTRFGYETAEVPAGAAGTCAGG
jgi:hypothetical protein